MSRNGGIVAINFRERLETAMQTMPLQDKSNWQVINGDSYKCLLKIVSADFEEMEEGERQVIVRDHLRKSFPLDELGQIEFIFTDAPSELVNTGPS